MANLTRTSSGANFMSKEKIPLTDAQQRTVESALESLTFLKLVARVQGVGIAKLAKRDLEDFIRSADRANKV
jgi:hypothetical protein